MHRHRRGPWPPTSTIESDADVSPVVVPLQGTAVAPPSGVTWGSNNNAGPAYTWNGGGALARTVQSGTQRLHVAYATDRVGGAWAENNGPYVGVYYIRSSTGATWSSTPKRLNSSSQHAARLGTRGRRLARLHDVGQPDEVGELLAEPPRG